MTARFRSVSHATDLEVKTRVAQGHLVRRVPVDEVIVRYEQAGTRPSRRTKVTEIEWPGGPASAQLIGATMDGSSFFVDLGPAKSKGASVAELIADVPTYPAVPTLRMRRTGRRLSWWAARVAMRKVEPEGLAKENRS